MAHIVILGAGTGGLSVAYGLREALDHQHSITVISASESFQFVPSNPLLALGLRKRAGISFRLRPGLEKKGIALIAVSAEKIDADACRIRLVDGESVDYDYLVVATGPRPAFELIEGAGPEGGYTQSVCTIDHAGRACTDYEKFLQDPGHVVVGAFQGASAFCAVYEYLLAMDYDLRRRMLRSRVPITFVTPEPYLGHLGLGGAGDSRELLESELRQRDIHWIANASTVKVEPGKLHVAEFSEHGKKVREQVLEFRYSMMMPAFSGVHAVAGVAGLCNPAGFVMIDRHQRSLRYRNIFAAGVCVDIPPVEQTPVPLGVPKTGYMIESMVTAIVNNIRDELAGKPAATTGGDWNAICLADLGDTGAAFIALPQIPPRTVAWAKKGKWVRLAKVAFEKYSMRKMASGSAEPIHEKYLLKALGISLPD